MYQGHPHVLSTSLHNSDGESNFSEINQQGLIYAFSASDEQALPFKIFRGKMALLSQKYVNIRPIALESLFVVNRRIWDFVGDIAAFSLDIKQEVFIFQCFT